ncbi:TPA: peptide pheromone inhibitor Ipd, partial [Enterococcus faecalis]|nr:peptide pheromone inhibitor Ipd [Enterococcus faecalis]HDT7989146.1 peptide pheromone inhibitor Ipd [Enterococcus faecalis]HDT8069945.1 peptide pheromone inhibitor Ipd [Enterococcus faecalis]HDV0867277.1 peptide pheromone inhibitor Ipd [Enterococcus faecalis]
LLSEVNLMKQQKKHVAALLFALILTLVS